MHRCVFFIHVSTGHAHFSNDKICISWVLMKPSMTSLVVENLESRLGKPALKSVDGCYTP